jgi:hypothetical protein
MDDTPFQESQTTFSPPRRRNQKRLALFIVAILIVIIFSIFITVANTGKSKPKVTTTTTTKEMETPTPTEEITPNPEETSTPTPKPTVNPVDEKSGLDRSDLTIEIQNGSGEAGVAGKASTFLQGLGYKISTTGNADNFDYQNVTIKVKNDSSKYLSLLKSDLGAEYTIGDASSDLSASVSADVLVIVGK